MFNFGNVVCWEADGSLISFGRMDDQVKIKVCCLTLCDPSTKGANPHRASELSWKASLPSPK